MDNSEQPTELATLQAKGIEILRNQRPSTPPLQFLLFYLAEWIDARHIAKIQETLPDGRRTFNPVFIHLPADGCRLTDLAKMANMSKQAMSEIVEEMLELGYLARFPDPNDRRAKIIVRAEKGLAAHQVAMNAFGAVDKNLEELLGPDRLNRLRRELGCALEAIHAEANSDSSD